jgi:GTP diphosphokinase / guanosine-3',5'-bis(diphosphate) 3'-diphosphatase
MNSKKELLNLMKFNSKQDIDLVSRAFDFAQKAHEGQKRFSGDPYFLHSLETAKILADLGMTATTVSAGLLHDALEDANAEKDEIEKEFGREILFLVEGVTKLGRLKYRGAQRHRESLRKLFVAISQDIRVIIIKLSDRLHNMKTLEYVPEHKRERIASETLEIYVPIAYRLGIRKLSRQLEDLAFPYLYPSEYQKTKELLKQRKKEDLKNLDKFQKSVKKSLAKKGITQISSDYRIKNLYSLYKKLEKRDWNIDKIYDISALRIILPDVSECYKALGAIHQVYRPLPGRIKDYIAFPKPNNYQALHTTIFTGYGNVVEIQIKTKEMHQEAEYGIASHILYKEKARTGNLTWIRKLLPFKRTTDVYQDKKEIDFDDVPSWIKELVEYQSSNKKESLEEIKADFFQRRIFVLTPKGDVVDLPVSSTPIDFAYSIHSDIGDHIGSVRINNKIAPIDTVLRNGDIVEIVINKKSRPSKKWLVSAKTTAAKKHIKAALSEKK